MQSKVLIATNGYKGTWNAVEYGTWFAKTMGMKVKLLGITERPNPAAIDEHHPLEDIFERSVALFKKQNIEFSLEVRNGEVEKVLPEESNADAEFITVVSPLGRPQVKRWLRGQSIRPLMEKITGPILYVPEVRLPLRKMLVSAGGLVYTEAAESLAVRIASVNHAAVSILHVVPPADLDYPTTREVIHHLNDLVETDTLQGRNLRKALEMAEQAGLNARIIMREGNVVEQILDEMRVEEFDLICMGSPYSVHSLRQYYRPNVTAEVAEVSRCPVLMARFVPPL